MFILRILRKMFFLISLCYLKLNCVMTYMTDTTVFSVASVPKSLAVLLYNT